MDRNSFATGIVKGLEVGSRAEIAGILEGDKIVWSSHEWRCVEHFSENMVLVIERRGIRTKVQYWPRGWETVESWQMSEKTNEEKKQDAKETGDMAGRVKEQQTLAEKEGEDNTGEKKKKKKKKVMLVILKVKK
jgi:hypothetical protein